MPDVCISDALALVAATNDNVAEGRARLVRDIGHCCSRVLWAINPRGSRLSCQVRQFSVQFALHSGIAQAGLWRTGNESGIARPASAGNARMVIKSKPAR